MTDYHINEKGEVRPCGATSGWCPFSSFDNHFNTSEKAQSFYENFMKDLNNPNKSVKFFFISNAEKHAFTNSDCAHFAKYFHKSSGMPICYVGDKATEKATPNERQWSHFVNRLPDGRFIDAEGIWTEEDLIERWQVKPLGEDWLPDKVVQTDPKELRKMGVVAPMFPEVKPSKTFQKMKKNLEGLLDF